MNSISTARASDLMINWELAGTTAARVAPAGPRFSAAQVSQEVAALRSAAAEAVDHVHRITGLEAARDLGTDPAETLVVDRATWSKANVESFRELLGPALKIALEQKPELGEVGSNAQVFGSSFAGAELGAVLAFLSANVLGQFDPFTQNRLILVAPNIVEITKELNVVPEDFRLWVCLHEQTHRVQFAAAPWLADHLKSKITQLSSSTMGMASGLGDRLGEVIEQMRAGRGLIEVIQTPQDRETMSHLTAVMSLLEGHANVIMDGVDASVVPSVKTIRRRFEARGKTRTPLEKFIRKLLQLDVKAAQYRDGQKFVGHIVDTIGMDSFNIIWESPEHLPTEHELHHPQEWIERMGLA